MKAFLKDLRFHNIQNYAGNYQVKIMLSRQSENQSRNNFATFIILALVCTGLNPLKLPPLYFPVWSGAHAAA